MNYLARLKQLESGEIFHHTPKLEPTKPTKEASDGFVGSITGAYENIHAENDADETQNQEEHWRWLDTPDWGTGQHQRLYRPTPRLPPMFEWEKLSTSCKTIPTCATRWKPISTPTPKR